MATKKSSRKPDSIDRVLAEAVDLLPQPVPGRVRAADVRELYSVLAGCVDDMASRLHREIDPEAGKMVHLAAAQIRHFADQSLAKAQSVPTKKAPRRSPRRGPHDAAGKRA